MLSAYGGEIIAYAIDGAILCRECMAKRYSLLTCEKIDAGLSSGARDCSPLIRYEIDTYAGEQTWEYAREAVGAFEDRHPTLLGLVFEPGFDSVRFRDRLTDRYAERHEYNETCGDCCNEIE